ncbi:MAG: thioredoxin family protein [Chitinophagaceae bacterium]
MLIAYCQLPIAPCNFNIPSIIFCLHPFTFAIHLIFTKKRLITFICALVIYSTGFSQNPYEILVERPNEKTLKGIISQDVLLKDTSFKWYAENLKGYSPNTVALEGLTKNKDSIQLLVFMGTWCEDSHFIIPKFYSLLDAAGFSQDRVTLIGVDREKKTLSHLSEALNVKNVPTILVMKNGKEIGRVIEFGKYGLFDKELGEIIVQADKH